MLSKTLVDVVAAQDLVTALSDGATKTALQNKLNAIIELKVKNVHELDLALKTPAKKVVLESGFDVSGAVDGFYGIAKSDVTIDGGGQTLVIGLKVVANNVTIEKLTVNGVNDYGIQFFEAKGGELNGVTVSNSTKGGLQINKSEVTIKNIVLTKNVWGGIEVTPDSKLVVEGNLTYTASDALANGKVAPTVWIDAYVANPTTVVTDAENKLPATGYYKNNKVTTETDNGVQVWFGGTPAQ